MYTPFQLAKKYVRYWLQAANGKGHGVHSPFVYSFIEQVLNDREEYACYAPIEQLRRRLKADNTVITVQDFGAGSRTGATKNRSVASIAKNALKPKKYSQLIFRIAKHYDTKTILELGTSLGVTSSYLASSQPDGRLHTMEGAPAIAAIAQQNLTHLGLQNADIHTGNFDETLVPLLAKLKTIDLGFIDGNHREEPTVRYFQQLLPLCHNNSILIFDDVHWSAEMEAAWEAIKNHERVTLSIDLFFIGIVFFKQEFKVKQHFAIRF